MRLIVRRMCVRDIPGVVGLQRECFPAPFPEQFLWTPEHLDSHLSRFAEGQIIAVDSDGAICGSASNCLISEETWAAHRSWAATVGGFHFENHDPCGKVLYGADISVHPDFRRMGVGRKLYEARFDLAQQLGVRYATVCRLPNYCDHSHLTAKDYAEHVATGKLEDRTLTPLLKMGLAYQGIIEDYMEDEESGNAGAILEREK